MKRHVLFTAFTLLTLFLISCSGRLGESESHFAGADWEESSRRESAAPLEAKSESAPSPMGQSVNENGEFDDRVVDDGSGAEPVSQTERKRIYNGSAAIVVDDVDDTRRGLEALAEEVGGYVESSYSDLVTLRIPAEFFDQVFERILGFGDVQSSRVETWDVTEAYTDLESQLETARKTRERLYALLERSTDPTERARILKEIGRLSEEIEILEQQLNSIAERVKYSRIVVQLSSRLIGAGDQRQIPFAWIAYLDPLTPVGNRLRGRFTVNLGRDFAVFSKEDLFLAENNDGIQISVSTIENSPRGDGRFWQNALEFHLGPLYSSADLREIHIGGTSVYGAEFVSKDQKPYRLFVGVINEGRQLHVVQIFSPTSALDFDKVYTALAEGELR